MSNRQLGWDDQQIRDRLSPPEIDEADKQAMNQPPKGEEDHGDAKDRVIESNPGSNSHGKKGE